MTSGQYERDWVLSELRRSMTWLAAPAEQQLQLLPQGTCAACELAGDGRHFSRVFLGNEGEMSQALRIALEKLVALIDALDASEEWRCWDATVLHTGTWWARLREQAGLVLRQLE